MRVPGWVIGVAIAAVLAGTFVAGRRYQASRDVAAADSATARANRAAALAQAADSAKLDSIMSRRKAETIARAIAEAEAELLRRQAAGHAKKDRSRDSALAAAKTAGDSLPIVTDQRDEARAGLADAQRADSLDRVTIASLRADSVDAVATLETTKHGHAQAIEALNAQIRSAAVELEKAKAERGFHLDLGGWKGNAVKLLTGATLGWLAHP